jgi:peptidoglycan biosynthesis protein MviN/MurJ (putative lipid II flippase)
MITPAAVVVGVVSSLSRSFGLACDRRIASMFGAPMATDACFALRLTVDLMGLRFPSLLFVGPASVARGMLNIHCRTQRPLIELAST